MIAIFPEIITCAASGDVEKLAILTRRYFGGGQARSPRLDVASLLARCGLGVKRIPLDCIGATCGKDENGRFQVSLLVQERLEPMEERFLLAHMLGHFLIHLQPLIAQGDFATSGYRESISPQMRYVRDEREAATVEAKREQVADVFAASLLLPRAMVKRALEKLANIDKTAAFFGVDARCLQRRLSQLGMANAAPTNFLDAEQRLRGGSPKEPVAQLGIATRHVVPPAFAASSYGQTQRATLHAKESATKSEEAAVASTAVAPANGDQRLSKGMQRLREIARQLDKSTR